MAPAGYFTREIIADELAAHNGLSVWGVLLETTSPLVPSEFVEHICPESAEEVLIGRVTPGRGMNLCKPSSWTDPDMVNFGSADTQAQVGGRKLGRNRMKLLLPKWPPGHIRAEYNFLFIQHLIQRGRVSEEHFFVFYMILLYYIEEGFVEVS